MPYARFDDRYDDHRKIKKALRREPMAVALHAMAITYSNRHNTDGIVDLDWVMEKLGLTTYRPRHKLIVIDVLVETNLFERIDENTFMVHDFLDWNLSSEQRETLAKQGRKGGLAKRRSASEGLSEGLSEGSSQGLSEGLSEGLSTPTPTLKNNSHVAPKRRDGGVRQVFEAWVADTGRTDRTILDSKRRRIIQRALSTHPLDDVLDAVRGWRHSPHHRGENSTATVYNDLELLLRDSSHIEKFRDLQRGTTHKPDADAKQFVAAVQARSAA